ncbi:glucose-1-phosphate adenylyltransferase [Mesobacillus zeae]|uniref:Glucose-1-phosphate adenylyltransferase n=1 Tax=Mesobacillus zeae TaxID=1917180 RepID=A0A398B6V3_9BACI|nr:glucose-1-phosphate adenylyltransferase [Mesobacillus zeae]RID85547.1 glucose-1-phosphate adenylyltransferase [Mesobacillus zeae]
MAKREVVAMILAGGRGSRLKRLTETMAKPAVPFGGKYRIIDFPLSNCCNSGINTIGILTQYQPHTLQNYINDGKNWDLDRRGAGVTFLPPFQCSVSERWYEGTAHAIAQNRQYIQSQDPEFVLVLSGDHIYKMNYSKMLEDHKKSGADATISAIPVPWNEANRFGIMNIDPENNRIHEFVEKPERPLSNLASMGIYIFNWGTLKYIFEELDKDPLAFNDFGKDILPYMLREDYHLHAYEFEGYWKDVGTLESLWEANMDLLSAETNPILQNKNWPIYTADHAQAPTYLDSDATVKQSVVSEGCEIFGKVFNSVISYGASIGKGAVVRNSVVLPNTVVGKNMIIENAIIGGGSGNMMENDVIYIHDGKYMMSI